MAFSEDECSNLMVRTSGGVGFSIKFKLVLDLGQGLEEGVIDLLVEEALDGCLDEPGLESISPMSSYVSTASSILGFSIFKSKFVLDLGQGLV